MATTSSSYLNRQTPGVYITEIDAFGNAIVGVQTALPIFIGYTEFAGDPVTGAALYNVPTQISSMNDYVAYFGGQAKHSFKIMPAANDTPTFTAYCSAQALTQLKGFLIVSAGIEPEFSLYWQMMLFFANGGGSCYVVSAGSYWADQLPTSLPDAETWLPGTIAEADLSKALTAAGNILGPTMTVIPEMCQLGLADYSTLACASMLQASTLQDRTAILDLPGCQVADSIGVLTGCQTNFSNAIAPQIASASYAAAYAPALVTTVVNPATLLYTDIQSADNEMVNNILTTQATMTYTGEKLAAIQAAIATAFPLNGVGKGANGTWLSGDGSAYPAQAVGQTLAQWQAALDSVLTNALPILVEIEFHIADQMNVMVPSGAMAGVWTKSDNQSGVWNAPANIALASVSAPLYNMSDEEQAGFNVPVNGQAIDVIRAQLNRGTVVWGARTLDGNSLDYRYVQVRRTLIYIEQSIKAALQGYVFSANDATTWATVNAAISSFLTGLWQQGGLMGSKPSDAFTVSVGLGSTMTAQDVLNGDMIVAVTLQMIHPAEFIELTFTQKMEG